MLYVQKGFVQHSSSSRHHKDLTDPHNAGNLYLVNMREAYEKENRQRRKVHGVGESKLAKGGLNRIKTHIKAHHIKSQNPTKLLGKQTLRILYNGLV